MGIRDRIEAGSEWSGVEMVVKDEDDCVGFDNEDDDESPWRFTKRPCCSYGAALA